MTAAPGTGTRPSRTGTRSVPATTRAISACWRSDSGQVYVRWDHTQGEWKIIAAFFPEVTPALNPERRLRSYLSLIIFRMRLRSPTCNWYR